MRPPAGVVCWRSVATEVQFLGRLAAWGRWPVGLAAGDDEGAGALSCKDTKARAELAETARLNPKITSIKSLTPLEPEYPGSSRVFTWPACRKIKRPAGRVQNGSIREFSYPAFK